MTIVACEQQTAGGREYFTGFSILSENGTGWAPGLTDVELGATITPEPGTLLMLGSGVLGLAAVIRRAALILWHGSASSVFEGSFLSIASVVGAVVALEQLKPQIIAQRLRPPNLSFFFLP